MIDDITSQVFIESELTRSTLSFPVVGIGASAGGLAPLLKFFNNMPCDSGMAFVVVVHLSPEHSSELPTLLQRATTMRVVSPEEATPIEPNTVYVIPPSKLLSMNDGYLRVTSVDRARGRQVAIDLFFRSLAIVHGTRAFAVVLSGTGTDGAVGITRIRGEGGVSIVQEPTDAEFDGMPRAAMATGTADWVLPADQIPNKLSELWRNAQTIQLPDAAAEEAPKRADAPPAEDALRDVLLLLRARTGHDFRNYKRATVLRRIERRLQVNGLPNLPAYRDFLNANRDEAQALLRDMLIGVTNFFRDAGSFEVLQREVIAPLVADTVNPGGVRVWVPGCSTGEEAYSIAMLLCEEAATLPAPPKIHLFGTDIDAAAIAQARHGTYPTSIETDVSPARLRRFFDREGDHFRIRKEVREKVMFAVHNLLHDPPFSRLDLISCRNLLIYLDRDVHAEILEMFHFALKPGGALFLGSSESADAASSFFSVVDKKHRIYRANTVPRSARYLPSLTMGSGVDAAPAPTFAPAPAAEKKVSGYAELHHRLAQQYAPPSVLVDPDSNIVHLSEHAGRYLRYTAGVLSHNLLALVWPELRVELRTAVFQALQSGKSVETRGVRVAGEGVECCVNMTVQPVIEPSLNARPLVLVMFHEVQTSVPGAEGEAPAHDPLVAQLESELARTRDELQSTIEHSGTSSEELKASNEELQAINEELRSATEELETSKEELQSINEELITVNHELKQKIEETAKINDDLQNLIASTDIGTVFVDRALVIKRYTPYATRLFNLIPGDIGRPLLDITHKLNYDRLADDVAEAFQSLRVIEREVSSESGRWYLARALPYRTAEDRIDGAVLTFVDITSRRKAEERTRLIAESTKDFALLTTDLKGIITTWNAGAERMFGFSAAEAVGQPIDVIFLPEDRQAGLPQEELARARAEGRAEDDRWHLRKDGERVFVSGIVAPLHEPDGELIGYSKIGRDITAAKRLEQERERLLREEAAKRAEAQAAIEMKDEFLAVMSHELKNPLNLIQLNADLLTRLPEARNLPAVQRAAGIIRRTIVSQAQIIDDLLDLSRLNTGKLSLSRSAVQWSTVVEAIVAAMSDEAKAKGITLGFECGKPPPVIDADPVRVEQIVWNLLANAVKFTPSGGRVDLRVAVDGGFGRLDVADTGRGIDSEQLPHIFDMFKQAEPTSPRAKGGLGIGLAVVKQLVDLHGGRIDASSAGRNRGSVFRVWLPLAETAEAIQGRAADAPHEGLARRRVLIVDDDDAGVDTLQSLLETEGMQVLRSPGPAEAASLVRETPVDVVLADVSASPTWGHPLLAALRGPDGKCAVPVIALSGRARPGDVQLAIEAGFRAHVTKPVSIERLLSTLDDVLGEARPA